MGLRPRIYPVPSFAPLGVLYITTPQTTVEANVETMPKIPGDRLVLGMLSAFRTLVLLLSKNGAIDVDEYVTALQQAAGLG